jgi:hypothetical protein
MQLLGCARSPPVIYRRSRSANVSHSTSRHQNADVTESRVVTYPWHPWHGRSVFIFAAVTKDDEPAFRCALEQADFARPREVPQWMFDAATCLPHVAHRDSERKYRRLTALDTLLHLTAASSGSAVIKAEHRSRSATGGAYATPASCTPTRLEKFDAEPPSELLNAHFVRLLRLSNEIRQKYDPSSLKVVTHVAAPCPPDCKERDDRMVGPIIHEFYGGSERCGLTFYVSEEWSERPGTIGRSRQGRVHVVGPEGGKELPVGEISVSSILRVPTDLNIRATPSERGVWLLS